MLTLHHLENSRSQRILWLLEELELDYKLVIHKRNPKTNLAPKELQDIHPLGKAPVLTDGEKVIAESAVIIEYLLAKHSDGRYTPEHGSDAWQEYHYWMHAAEGSIMPFFVLKLILNAISGPKVPFIIRPISKAIAKQVGDSYVDPSLLAQLRHMNSTLENREWFTGEQLTGADFQMSFPAQGAVARPELAKQFPNIQRYVNQIETRPAYKRALEKGGPYQLGA